MADTVHLISKASSTSSLRSMQPGDDLSEFHMESLHPGQNIAPGATFHEFSGEKRQQKKQHKQCAALRIMVLSRVIILICLTLV